MEVQKKRPLLKIRVKGICNGGFVKEVTHHQETPEKIKMKLLVELNNEAPSLSEDENISAETYSNGKSSGSDLNGNSSCPLQYVSSNLAVSDSPVVNLPPQGWPITARRGRKSSTLSSKSLSSIEKEEEPSFDEIEVANALLILANGIFLCETEKLQRERDSITKFPQFLNKKQKIEDSCVGYAEDQSKIVTVDKNTSSYRDEFVSDMVKKTNSEAVHKRIPALSTGSGKFRCDNCKKSFSCHQALGGHKSSCNSNYGKSEVGECSMRNTDTEIYYESSKELASSGAHQCKICSKCFPSGQALGGHQRQHQGIIARQKREHVEEEPHVKISLVSPPENISMDCSLYPSNSLTSAQEAAEQNRVQEAAGDNIASKKVRMLDLNEHPPKDEDDEYIDFRCSEPPFQSF